MNISLICPYLRVRKINRFINIKLLPIFIMVSTEYLAISAIFIAGFYFGFKLKEAVYNLRSYVAKRKHNN